MSFTIPRATEHKENLNRTRRELFSDVRSMLNILSFYKIIFRKDNLPVFFLFCHFFYFFFCFCLFYYYYYFSLGWGGGVFFGFSFMALIIQRN